MAKKTGFQRPRTVTILCLISLVFFILFAVFVPVLGLSPTTIHPDSALLGPFSIANNHFFVLGTDDLGRDLVARLAVGAQVSLLIGIATAIFSVAIGTFYGTVSALSSAKVDTVLMRIVDIIYALPGLMVVILFSVFLGRGVLSLVLALTLFSWPDTARLIRGQVLALKQQDYVEAFHSLGGPVFRLVWVHLLPNAVEFIILSAAVTIPRAVLTESTLSFIGLGVEPPLSSWGSLASEGWQLARVAPHLLILPASCIFIAMVALNLLGDRLRIKASPKEA
ncbi:MAG: ABC transporter permease [Cyanobacteria bacterium P01_H01_bin.74]